MKLNLYHQNLKKKNSNTKFHENPPSEGRIIRCGVMDTKKDKTKLRVVVRNFVKVPKKVYLSKEINRPDSEDFPNISRRLRTAETLVCTRDKYA